MSTSVCFPQVLQKLGLDHPIIHTLHASAICIANPFPCKMVHKKASFAVASDERNAYLFNADELGAIRQHIPVDRVVEEQTTVTPFGQTIDLLPWAVTNKDNLVLKPDEYGGKGVLIGWETEQDAWSAAVQAALDDPSIVQSARHHRLRRFPRISA